MSWRDIDFNDKIITVRNTKEFITKSKRERIVPINSVLVDILQKQLNHSDQKCNDGYVFFRIKGVRLNVDYVSKKFKRACRKLNLNESINLHVLRHSFASNLVSRGADLYVVKELLGHSSISVTQRYSHLRRENLFEAVNKLKHHSL